MDEKTQPRKFCGVVRHRTEGVKFYVALDDDNLRRWVRDAHFPRYLKGGRLAWHDTPEDAIRAAYGMLHDYAREQFDATAEDMDDIMVSMMEKML